MSESSKFLSFPIFIVRWPTSTEYAVSWSEHVAVQVSGVSCKGTCQVEAICDLADGGVVP
jgi:hypothetical protein